jgi:molybdopterin-binding protein
VAKITPWGPHYRVVVDCDGIPLVALITRPSFLELGLEDEKEVVASFKATAAHVIRLR